MRAHRKALGISVSQLAEMLGVTNTTIYNWEHGIKTNSPLFLEKKPEILRILGCEFEDLTSCVSISMKDRVYLHGLRFWLSKKKMPYEKLAAICNLSRGQIADYVKLTSRATVKDAEKIAYVLGISVDALCSEDQSAQRSQVERSTCLELDAGAVFDLLLALKVKSFNDLEKRTGLLPSFLAKIFSSPIQRKDAEALAIALGVPLGYILNYHEFRFVCDKLWKIVHKQNISAGELAEKIGYSKEVVRKIIERVIMPTMFDANEIAKALGVAVSEIGHPYCYLDKIGRYCD